MSANRAIVADMRIWFWHITVFSHLVADCSRISRRTILRRRWLTLFMISEVIVGHSSTR